MSELTFQTYAMQTYYLSPTQELNFSKNPLHIRYLNYGMKWTITDFSSVGPHLE